MSVAYGTTCAWWDSADRADHALNDDAPLCPHCGGPVIIYPEEVSDTGDGLTTWLRGRNCYQTRDDARIVFDRLVDVSDVDHVQLLVALYRGTRAQGFGALHDTDEFDEDLAREMLERKDGRFCFDYVCGRPIKTRIPDDNLVDPILYDRDAGLGRFAEIVAGLR